jgi:hypothetical protein
MKIAVAAYVLILGLATMHFYKSPYWVLDLLGYMGNARLHETVDPVVLHDRVYGELRSSVPPEVFDLLTGAPGVYDEGGAKHDRFINPYHYAEFLPCFAIRPMYNLTIYWVARTGLGLVQAVRLVSALSYGLLGILVLVWLGRYTRMAPLLALLIMLTPHISLLGRNTGADGLSVLLGMLSLYLIFENNRVFAGILILSAAIWVRTDNIALIMPVLFVLFLQRRLEGWKASVVGLIAISSVLMINRTAGDYGIQMLYYRNFFGIPIAPAEMIARFTIGQYAYFFLKGFKDMLTSFVPLFILLGLLGWNQKTGPLLGIAVAYATLHYIILPNWVDRWMAVLYLLTSMTAAFRVQPKEIVDKLRWNISDSLKNMSVANRL